MICCVLLIVSSNPRLDHDDLSWSVFILALLICPRYDQLISDVFHDAFMKKIRLIIDIFLRNWLIAIMDR